MAKLLRQAYDCTNEKALFQPNCNTPTELFIEEQHGNMIYNSFKIDGNKEGSTSINDNVFSNYTVNSAENVTLKHREILLFNLKKEAKKLMEESITCKYINESSWNVISFCGAVDACLQYGLRRGRLGIFRLNNTEALLAKVSKTYPPAQNILDKIRNQTAGKQNSRPFNVSKRNASNCATGKVIASSNEEKFLWIRVALFEKSLANIVEYLVSNSDKYYEPDSIVADACDGPILASLLVGPCAMEFQSWTESNTSSNHLLISNKKHSSPTDADSVNCSSGARTIESTSDGDEIRIDEDGNDSMELLHHDMKSILLYGKNNVLVQHSELVDSFRCPGYLSLSHVVAGLFVTWTPNDLVKLESSTASTTPSSHLSRGSRDRVIRINVQDIAYVHCHQIPGVGGTAVLTAHNGVQHPPFHFPPGDHLLTFLTCLENGLLPHGQLDPPLWARRSKFRKKRADGTCSDKKDTVDHVFQIIYTTTASTRTEPIDENRTEEFEKFNTAVFAWHPSFKKNHVDQPIECKCIQSSDVIRDPLISQMFYAWLNYCRYMKTLRVHLGDLINSDICTSTSTSSNQDGLSVESWRLLLPEGRYREICQLVYQGGCATEIRRDVWPFLLGHYDWTSDQQSRNALDDKLSRSYDCSLSKWLAVERLAMQKMKTKTGLQSTTDVNNDTSFRSSLPLENLCIVNSHNAKVTSAGVIDDQLSTSLISHEQHFEHSYPCRENENVECFTTEIIDLVMLNVRRIEDDMFSSCEAKCVDREKLRNILCVYVWQNLQVGYVQGMCDLLAPFLTVFEDERLAFVCFQRFINLTTHSGSITMDHLFASMRTVIEILDAELFEQMQNRRGDYTHFNFCRRWLLYHFSKELRNFDDVCYLWEVIWAARHVVTDNLGLFCSLALLVNYREQIMHNNMDFCEIMRFYNDMSKQHCVHRLAETSRNLVLRLQLLLNRK